MARIGSIDITSNAISPEDVNAKLGVQTAHGLPIGEGENSPFNWTGPVGDGQILIGSATVGNGDPVLGNITGIGGISVNSGPGSIVISGSGAGFSWTTVDSVSPPNPVLMSPDNGYIAKGGALVTLNMPTTAMLGQVVQIVGNNTPWMVNANGNTIHFFSSPITTALKSTSLFDTLMMVCVATNVYVVTSTQGNIELN